MGLPQEEQFFTYADYKEWELAEGERYELIYGKAYAMLTPNLRHQDVLGSITTQFYNFLRGKPIKVILGPIVVRLFYAEDDSDDTVVQPDMIVICDEKKRGPEGCRGAPDLVAEVLSPSNTAIEMERKFRLYRKAGVKEYWIIDPENNSLKVYLFQDNKILTGSYENDDIVPVTTLPGLNISLEQVFED